MRTATGKAEYKHAAPEGARRSGYGVCSKTVALLYVKLGPVLSRRPDMPPIEYAQEPCKLIDPVSPFSRPEIRNILEEDLGARSPKDF